MAVSFKASAPTRAFDCGRWGDGLGESPESPDSFLHNIAFSLRARATLEPQFNDGNSGPSGKLSRKVPLIEVSAPDLPYEGKFEFGDTSYKTPIRLIEAAVNRMRPTRSFKLSVHSDAPRGCGLGGSAALSVAIVGAISAMEQRQLHPKEIAQLAREAETEELKEPCGWQDQIAAAFGGANLIHARSGTIFIANQPISQEMIKMIARRLIIIFVGPRQSYDIHRDVIARLGQGDEKAWRAIGLLRQVGLEAGVAFSRGEIDKYADCINRTWRASCDLSPKVSTPLIDSLEEFARSRGAQAFLANGAGGGGSVGVLTEEGQAERLRSLLDTWLTDQRTRETGDSWPRILDCEIDQRGLIVERFEST